MKFQIAASELKKALETVNHATANVTTTPILENILITITYNSAVFVSNNLEMAIEYTVSESISIEKEGSFSIPSKLFTSYVGLVQDDIINIELLPDDSLQISSDSWSVKIKKGAWALGERKVWSCITISKPGFRTSQSSKLWRSSLSSKPLTSCWIDNRCESFRVGFPNPDQVKGRFWWSLT